MKCRIQAAEMTVLQKVAVAQHKRLSEELIHSEGASSRAAAPLYRKDPAEVVQASIGFPWLPPHGGYLSTSHWEETL